MGLGRGLREQNNAAGYASPRRLSFDEYAPTWQLVADGVCRKGYYELVPFSSLIKTNTDRVWVDITDGKLQS